MSNIVNDTPVIDTKFLYFLLVCSAMWVACCIAMFVLDGGFGRHDACMDDECDATCDHLQTMYEMHEDAPPVSDTILPTVPRPIPRRAVDNFHADF